MHCATFIIPFRADFPERVQNLSIVVNYLSRFFPSSEIMVHETGFPTQKESLPKSVKYLHHPSNSKNYSKTKAINDMLRQVKTPITIMHDVDCLTNVSVYRNMVKRVESQEEDSIITGTELLDVTQKSLLNDAGYRTGAFSDSIPCVIRNNSARWTGGIVLTLTDVYRRIGGENENFLAWGAEDMEKLHRLITFGYTCGRSNGTMYHMIHPRVPYHQQIQETETAKIMTTFETLQKMTAIELCQYYGLNPHHAFKRP